MRLTLHADYSLRLLLYLAAAPERRASVGEIAEAFKVSRNHLVKVAHHLGKLGYIETIRGHGGGLTLARPPGLISIGDVVRDTEPDFALVECFDRDRDQCAITCECGLKTVLVEAQKAFLATLSRYTVGDIVESPKLRAQLIRLRPE